MKYWYCPRCKKERLFKKEDETVIMKICNNPCQEVMVVKEK